MKILLLALCLPFAICACKQQTDTAFTESDKIITNPGQGFASCRQKPRTDGILPYGVGYGRYDWSDFEPEDGKYDWSKIDELIKNYAKIGLPVSFRITCANYHSKKPYSTPKWALDKGIKYKPYNWEKERQNPKNSFTTMTRYTPYFDEPLLIELHTRFVKELAKRYDGNPHISSIDLGGYGNWGEWHTYRLGVPEATPQTRRKFADAYLDNFKKTPIVFMSDDAQTLEYALEKGGKFPRVGIRRDGVGGPWHYKNWIGSKKYSRIPKMGEIWKSQPVLLEFISSPNKQKEWSMQRAVDFILGNHCNVFNDNFHFKNTFTSAQDAPLIEKLKKYIGARIVIDRAHILSDSQSVEISLKGRNVGCAKIYLPYELVYELRTPDGKTAASFLSKENPSDWLPGKISASDKFELPKNLPKGKYELVARLAHKGKVLRDFAFAVVEANADGSITIAKISI